MTENEAKIDIDEARSWLEYDPDTGKIYWRVRPCPNVWPGQEAGTILRPSPNARIIYKIVKMKGVSILAHRWAWVLYYGHWPENDIDHINGDGLDNRIDNLRDVTNGDNMRNTWKHRAGHLLGTNYFGGRWSGVLHVDGKNVYLGRYDTAEEAHAAYLEAEEKYKRTGKV